MTQQQYEDKLNELTNCFEIDKKRLYKEYALSNNTVKEGDIIEDFTGMRIKVDRISVYVSFGLPQCVYAGFLLTKKGEISKLKDNRSSIYQENLKKP